MLWAISVAETSPSTLRVAVCQPGQAPYVITLDDGTPAGFDLGKDVASALRISNLNPFADLWNKTYFILQSNIREALSDPAQEAFITSEMISMVGDSPPALLPYTFQDMQDALTNHTLDIGLCGVFMSQGGDLTRLKHFDFTIHYISSGLQAAVPSVYTKPSLLFAFNAIVDTLDARAQLVFILLLLFVMVFGHIFAAAERSGLHGATDVQIRSNFFEGSQDGMWYAFVLMSTVGLGDIVPRTFAGRFLSVAWMFTSIALTSMLYAIVATNFSNLQLIPSTNIVITSPADLAPYRIGTALSSAANILPTFAAGVRVTEFPSNTQADVFRCLLNGSIDVAVERPETIDYFNRLVPEFQGRLNPVGPVFFPEGVAFAVQRPSPATPHPLLHLLTLAVAQATRTDYADFEAIYGRWFGADSAPATNAELSSGLESDTVEQLRTQALIALLVAGLAWGAGSTATVLRRLPAVRARNHTCRALRCVLGIIPDKVFARTLSLGLLVQVGTATLRALCRRGSLPHFATGRGICLGLRRKVSRLVSGQQRRREAAAAVAL